MMMGPARADTPVSGSTLFLQCKACHTATKGGANSVGPNLWGIAGAKAGTRPGYAYSLALTKASITWTPAELDAFLAKPNGKVPGTKMIFFGVKDAAQRKALILYLASLKGK